MADNLDRHLDQGFLKLKRQEPVFGMMVGGPGPVKCINQKRNNVIQNISNNERRKWIQFTWLLFQRAENPMELSFSDGAETVKFGFAMRKLRWRCISS